MVKKGWFLLAFLLAGHGAVEPGCCQTLSIDFGESEPGAMAIELLADRTLQVTHQGVTFKVGPAKPEGGVEVAKPEIDAPPAGKYGLAKAADTAAAAVNDQQKSTNRVSLGAMFVVLADLIRAGKFQEEGFAGVTKITGDLTPRVLGTAANDWNIWAQDIGEELAQLQNTNKIQDLDDLQLAYREIQQGLVDPTKIDRDLWILACRTVRSYLKVADDERPGYSQE